MISSLLSSPNKCQLITSLSNKNHFNALPHEVQLKIFQYFAPKELCTSIAPVCKNWHRLSKDAVLWTKLSFCIMSEQQNHSMCEILQRCSLLRTLKILSFVSLDHTLISFNLLRDLDLSSCKHLNASLFQNLVSNCPRIEILNLANTNVDVSCIRHVVSLPVLQSLNLSGCSCVDDECVVIVANNCSKLFLLNVDDEVRITDYSVRVLAEKRQSTLCHLFLNAEELTEGSMASLSKCEKLQTLGLSNCFYFNEESLKELMILPNLVWLKISCFSKLDSLVLESYFLSSRLAVLKVLDINYEFLSDQDLMNLAKTCVNIRVLSLPWCWHITDVGLEAVIEGCRQLSWLTLLDNHIITGKPLLQIPTKLPNLMYLNIEKPGDIICDMLSILICSKTDLNVYVDGFSYITFCTSSYSECGNIKVSFLVNEKESVIWTKDFDDSSGRLRNLSQDPKEIFF